MGNKAFDEDLHGFRREYRLDSLYRVIRTRLPAVPASTLSVATSSYEPTRRYDLVGNVVQEVDGNGQSTTRVFDFANRLLSVTDAVGRIEASMWDGNGNRRSQTQKQQGATGNHLTRTMTYDALNRPLDTTEVFSSGGSTTTQFRQSRYQDSSGWSTASKDARGFVTTVKHDDLGRAFETLVDDSSSSLLTRTPDDSRAGSALNLLTKAEYDGLGNQTAVVDAEGRRTESTVDALGRVVARRYPLTGVAESWSFNATGAVLSSTDKRGVTRQKKYDLLGRETTSLLVETQSGSPLEMTARNYVDIASGGLWKLEETDAAGSTTARFTDALGRVVTTRDAKGFTSEARYDAKALRRTRDAKGYVTETDTDAVYRPTAVRELDLGGATPTPTYQRSTSYDDAQLIEVAKDWRGTETKLERDGLGRLTKRTRGTGALVQVDTSVFNAGGQEVLHTDANGHQTQWVYDGVGRKTLETKALGTPEEATWRHTYDNVGNLTETKGPRTTGITFDVRTTFDGLNRAVRVEDALGNTTFHAYDGAGNLVCEKTPLGDTATAFGHGAAPTTLAGVNAAACQATRVTRFDYEEEGQLTKVTTALGHETTYVWDASRKRMLAKQDGNLHLTTYAYDARAQRTDEFQHLDAHPRVTSRLNVPGAEPLDIATHAGTLRWSATYDKNGNAQTQTDALGQVTTQTHGLRNRLDAVTYSLHTLPRVLPSVNVETYEYDENGNTVTVTQDKQTATGVVPEVTLRTFDVLDRLETETRYDGKLTVYGYDAKGNRKSVTDFQGVATKYLFDGQDRLKKATTPEGATDYGYFEDGLAKTTDFFNGLHEGRCYDDAGRLTALVTARTAVANACLPPSFLSRYRYAHDAEGNRLAQVEELTAAGASAVGPAETTLYGYDEESRLVGVSYPDATTALYQLDAVGNRVGERKAPTSAVAALTMAAFLSVSPAALTHDVVAVFNRADWLETVRDSRAPAKDATFTWDVAGNLKRQQTVGKDRRFDWDVKQTLTRVDDDGVEAGRYDYGADGLRSKRVTALESVEYVLDGMQVLVEADGNSSAHPAKRRYTYAGTALAVTEISGSTRTTKALHLDALGSPGTETTQTGVVAKVRQYDAWGQYRNGTAPVSTDAKLGYTGHQYDPESGLVYARARYYDPEYGRFLSRDTFEGQTNSAPSLHRFVYTRDNPLRYTDPSGNCPNCVAGLAGAGVGFLVGFGISSALQLSRGEEFSWKKALASGVGGGISGGMAGLTAGASLVTQVGAGAVLGSAAGATATRTLLGQETTLADVRDDGIIGGITFGLGKGIGSAFARSSNGQMTAAIKELEKETVAAAKQAAQQTAAPAVVKQVFEDGAAAADEGAGGFVLRGTTEGYPGSPAMQQLRMTPTTTDPGAAVIFGSEAVTSNGGKGVVLVAPRRGLPIGEANVLAAKELEVGVELAPSEFAKRAQSFELETVRAAVKKAGVEVPRRIYGKEGIDDAIRDVPRLTPEQVDDVLKNLGVKK